MVLFSRYDAAFLFVECHQPNHTVTVPAIVRFHMSCRVERRNKIQQLRSKSNSTNLIDGTFWCYRSSSRADVTLWSTVLWNRFLEAVLVGQNQQLKMVVLPVTVVVPLFVPCGTGTNMQQVVVPFTTTGIPLPVTIHNNNSIHGSLQRIGGWIWSDW